MGLLGTCVALLLVSFVVADQVILPPIDGATGPDIAWIYFPGTGFSPEAYSPMTQAVQKHAASGLSLWIGIPQVRADVTLDTTIRLILNDLANQGFPDSGTFFIGGHAEGAAQLQEYVGTGEVGVSIHGSPLALILHAAPISRNFRTTARNLPLDTITLSGQVDGIVRISRIAEAVETQCLNPPDASWTEKYPVILIPGINHMSFASGTPPSTVAKSDLKMLVTEDEAHDLIGQYTAAFMQKIALGTSSALLVNGTAFTNEFVQPLIDALKLEGSTHFQSFCYEGQCDTGCYCGSPWVAQYAQKIMGGVDGATYDVEYSSQAQSVLSASCAHGACSISVNTWSMNEIPKGDPLADGFTQVSATDIFAMLVSRAAIQRSTVNSTASEKDLDDVQSICAQINQAAYDWGLAHAGAWALGRFKSLGQPFIFGNDTAKTTSMTFTDTTDRHGKSVCEVVSPSVVNSDGSHYCKLLSPARVMEWIYTDGLHKKDALTILS